ncbi:MAG: response regulator, partial [Desulfovibrionaceae bacterium]|nr:response regulator [Desulfovibrionaceae bacterium]
MREKILFVDDDPNILNSMRRNLRNKFNLSTSESGEQGLRAIEKEGPFAVVVSDLKMPGMNGIDFLARVRDLSKDTVRVMLTGYAELESAISAVNEGNVFRFLTKPCDMSTLVNTLVQCLEQYRLITAERELLDKTLSGSVELCSEILSMVNPVAFDTSSRIKRYVRYIAEHKDPENLWQYEIAAMLSQIGCVTLKPETLEKVAENRPLNGEEQQVYDMHPTIAYDLLSRIPRMAGVAKMIMYQNKNYDGTGNPREKIAGEDIPLGARILKLVLDYDMHLSQM